MGKLPPSSGIISAILEISAAVQSRLVADKTISRLRLANSSGKASLKTFNSVLSFIKVTALTPLQLVNVFPEPPSYRESFGNYLVQQLRCAADLTRYQTQKYVHAQW
jgi:hypothetical protein